MKNKVNWGDVKPGDGFFAESFISEALAELAFGLKANGEIVFKRLIARCMQPKANQIAEITRKAILWEGMAEYMNAGGDLQSAVSEVKAVVDRMANKGEDYCFHMPHWRYFSTGINQNGNRVHEFIRVGDGPVEFVRWVRHEYVDTNLTEEQIMDNDVILDC